MRYLDHNATSPLLPEVLAEMMPWLGVPANPSSAHRAGQRAATAVERAREQVAALVQGTPEGVVFTSGATEANHLFVRGTARSRPVGTWVTSPLEHPSVGGACERIAERGWRIVQLPVDPRGKAVLSDLDLQGVGGLSLQAANHETGVLQPVERALELCQQHGVALHVDATQAAGKVELTLRQAQGVVLSSHKIGGPAGVGALVLQHGEPFAALISGGSQERGRRAGTVNTAGVVGFGAACALASKELKERRELWSHLMDDMHDLARHLGLRIPSGDAARVPNTLCMVAPGLRGETLVQALDLRGICVSSGAACASGSLRASTVLTAMGEANPHGALRISLGPRTTKSDVDAFIDALPQVLRALREPDLLDIT